MKSDRSREDADSKLKQHVDIWANIKLTLPVLFAFFPLGIGFGLVVHEHGLPWYVGCLMSFFIYAGSVEFVVAAMLVASESILEIAITGFFINFRHVFYGLSVFHVIPKSGFARFYTICTLSDETFALFTTLGEKDRKTSFLIAFLNHMYWFLSVCLGLILANGLSIDFSGVEFCLPALFIVLTIEQYQQIRKMWPFLISAFTSLIAYLFFINQFLVVSIGLACILITFYKKELKVIK